jgi:hypothetical protein
MKRFKVMTGGHVELPREFHKRWRTECVELEDHGEYVVLRPAPNAPGLGPREGEDFWPEPDVPLGMRRGSSGAGY